LHLPDEWRLHRRLSLRSADCSADYSDSLTHVVDDRHLS